MPRFLCLSCRRTFSRQTFSTSYYLKRPDLLLPLAAALQAGGALRQIAQDLPFGVGTPVGSRSWFVYGLDPAPHARAGRRSPLQRRRLRRRPPRHAFGGYLGSTRRVLGALLPLVPAGRRLDLVGEGHPAYDQVASEHRRVRLHKFPNPKRGPLGSPRSAGALARDRAMFASDLLHAIVRHTLAHHRRETIAFGRRLNAILERMALMAVWRNFVKRRSERRPEPLTPAMQVGLTTEVWDWSRVLARRLFAGRESLFPTMVQLYRRDWTTPTYLHNTRHQLKHAY